MANKRISELPVASAIAGDELIPVLQSGETRKTTVNSVLTDIETRKVGFVDMNSGALSPTFNTIKLSTNPTLGAISAGEFYYDVAEQTATLNLGTTNLQVGQEMYVRVRNASGSAIANGVVVYINGASGTRPTIALARSDSTVTSTTVIGVTTESIANGALGSVTISGLVGELNTTSFSEGTPLYLSSSVAGSFVSTAPNYPNRLIEIGRVVRQHATLGQILVRVDVNNANYLKGELSTSENASVGAALIGYNSARIYSAGTVGAQLNDNGVAISTVTSGLSTAITNLTNAINTKVGLTSTTGAAEIPTGTDGQRPTGVAGHFRFNTSSSSFEGYNGSSWGTVGGGASGAVNNPSFYENDLIATADYEIGQNELRNCTISIATPAVITQANTFVVNQPVRFKTTGTLPTGIASNSQYYVSATGLTTGSFQISLTKGGASVATSGTQSGTQSCGKIKNAMTAGPYEINNGSIITVPTGSVWSVI